MSFTTRTLRALTGVAIAGSVAFIGHADAAAKTTKLYFGAAGCPATDTWLDTAASTDPDNGCGYYGGAPLDEAFGATPVDFTTKKTVKPMRLDGSRKVTGVFSVGSWTGAGGVGEVTVEISMTGKTKAGKTISFGDYSTKVTPSPVGDHADVPFTFTVPKSANGQTFSKITFSVAHAGQNLGWNADDFNGNSYANIPTK